MFKNKKSGQSTLEYIAVFAAVVAVIVGLAYTKIKPATEKVFDSATTKINTAAQNFNK